MDTSEEVLLGGMKQEGQNTFLRSPSFPSFLAVSSYFPLFFAVAVSFFCSFLLSPALPSPLLPFFKEREGAGRESEMRRPLSLS